MTINSRFTRALRNHILILDGAMGTLLHERGLKHGQAPEELNLANPAIVQSVHADYYAAGADMVLTNTFGATRKKLDDFGLGESVSDINTAAVKIARKAAEKTNGFVAGDIGPLGSYLTPLGPLSFDEAYGFFREQAQALASAKPDCLIIETMSDIRELKAAIIAAKDAFHGPIIAQMTFTETNTTVTGTDPLSFITVAESLDVHGIGLNCGIGPGQVTSLVKQFTEKTHLPISVKPNRGIPQLVNRQTIYPGTIDEFVTSLSACVTFGANLVGGCCGTDPSFIQALAQKLKNKKPRKRSKKTAITRFSSRVKTLEITPRSPLIIIGERINPTGRKILQQELSQNNFTRVRSDAKAQVEAGAHMLDVNMGLPAHDEKTLMEKALQIVQSAVQVPLCIDSASTDVLEHALKNCEGKPLVNSVSGEQEKMSALLPIIKRYGAGFIGLLIDENGI
ncbi:MAG: 5-methyltetrahydrofolate--homocysteine methyltransferase, partial [Elusimicrobia bacterium]|nr:5-methyltetrahydrofolate--homocysteine methyltransferase [Elusimicrobiota bacterium]MBD3412151.1 5-methyltetrahydrofolate--homocysteine methyltransferase [Elusimicrobiota bacterium]